MSGRERQLGKNARIFIIRLFVVCCLMEPGVPPVQPVSPSFESVFYFIHMFTVVCLCKQGGGDVEVRTISVHNNNPGSVLFRR